MKREKKIIWICLAVLVAHLLVVFCGCKSPSERQAAAEDRISSINDKISDVSDHQIAQAAGMVYATDLALDRADDSQPVNVAREFNGRAQSLLGHPSAEDSGKLRGIVDDLLSQIVEEKKRGQKALNQLDAKIIALEKEKKSLGNELESLQQKLDAVNKKNAEMADKEAKREANWWNPFDDLKRSLMKFLGWGVVILACFILLPILGTLFPAAMPIVSAIGHVVGSAFGWLIKAIPGAINGAGVVAKNAFDVVNATKDKLVNSIEQWQAEQKNSGDTDYKSLSTILGTVLDDAEKKVVTETKANL